MSEPSSDDSPNLNVDGFKRPKLSRQLSLWTSGRQSAFGVILCIICAFAYATNSFLAKYLMEQGVTTPYFVAFSRQTAIVFTAVPMTRFFKVKLVNSPELNKHWKAVSIRCFFGSAALLYFVGLYLAPLADIGVIFTSGLPIFSGILARIFLDERLRYTDVVFVISAAVGVTLILRPPYIFPSDLAHSGTGDTSMFNRLAGGGCAMLASLFAAIAVLGARSCVGEVHYTALVFWNSIIGFCVSFIVMVAVDGFESPCTQVNRLLIILAGVSGLFAQSAATSAVRYVPPVIAGLSSSIELAFLFFYQTTILGHLPHWFSILGSSVILSAMVLLVCRAWCIDKLEQKETDLSSKSIFSPKSKYFKYLHILTK